jgi:N-acetylmuramoyl-L-alanine amidase
MNMMRIPKETPPAPRIDDQLILARMIWDVARCGSVREREAIAAVIVNRRRRDSASLSGLSAEELPDDPRRLRPDLGDMDFDCCRRIARRAIAGVMTDPTNGAIRYHFVDACPPWSLGHMPSAWVGDRLFYRMED